MEVRKTVEHGRIDRSVIDQPSPEPAELGALMHERSARIESHTLPEVVIGELIAISDDGLIPLVLYPGQPGRAAVRARSVLDLVGAHVGKQVVLSFENGDAARPIVMGVLRNGDSQPLDAPGHVEIERDGERMIVRANEQLVLRCGSASITLTKAGKVIIEGAYIVSRSTGANRIKGGSIQLN